MARTTTWLQEFRQGLFIPLSQQNLVSTAALQLLICDSRLHGVISSQVFLNLLKLCTKVVVIFFSGFYEIIPSRQLPETTPYRKYPRDNPPTRGPDPNRPTTWGSGPNPSPNPNPNRPTGRGIIWKLTLTHILDPKTNWYTRVGRELPPGVFFVGGYLRGELSPGGGVICG